MHRVKETYHPITLCTLNSARHFKTLMEVRRIVMSRGETYNTNHLLKMTWKVKCLSTFRARNHRGGNTAWQFVMFEERGVLFLTCILFWKYV